MVTKSQGGAVWGFSSPFTMHCSMFAANNIMQQKGWSVCLPLLICPCTIKSRSSLLAPAHPGGPGKRAVKWLWCGMVWCSRRDHTVAARGGGDGSAQHGQSVMYDCPVYCNVCELNTCCSQSRLASHLSQLEPILSDSFKTVHPMLSGRCPVCPV